MRGMTAMAPENFNTRRFKLLLCILFYLGAAGNSGLYARLPIPRYTSPVVDQTGILKTEEREKLIHSLRFFKSQNGPEIAILIIPSLKEENLERFSLRVARSWKLGRSRVNDGVLLLVVLDDRKMRIEVGTGLEKKLTDERCRFILDRVIKQRFQAKKYYDGVDSGISAIKRFIKSENTSADSDSVLPIYLTRDTGNEPATHYLPFFNSNEIFNLILISCFVGFIFWLLRTGKSGGGGGTGSGSSGDSLSYSSGNSGGSSFGGGDSGGSFGGGGASGSW